MEVEQQNRSETEIERQNRVEALANAVRHRLREEDADAIVRSAQKYFEFLQGVIPNELKDRRIDITQRITEPVSERK
tara:strand:- start:271 stop:501 length:231 start_codon:yes stop_codon:yes gene_type:complete